MTQKRSKKGTKKKLENFSEIEDKGKRLEALIHLGNDIIEKERREPLPFNDFLSLSCRKPDFVFRDIFQVIYDMLHHYVPEGIEEYPSPDSVGFIKYDFSKLFVDGCDSPFFADRLFSNRFMNLINGFRQGTRHNLIYLFEGPPGSGKSTFLNNFLFKLEEYMRTEKGTMYNTYWHLDIEKLGGFQRFERRMMAVAEEHENKELESSIAKAGCDRLQYPQKYLDFECPKHDHPILQIPITYRKKFLDELIPDEEFKKKLFSEKQYEWVLKDIPCSICKSLYTTLLEAVGDPLKVFDMLKARKLNYNRQFGEGISIFNPGDLILQRPLSNPTLQHMLTDLLKKESVEFIYSYLAKTNNGVHALMDIKEYNIERLMNLHGIISDGVHKVELVEEQLKSFFVGLINPDDKKHYEKVPSFQDRIVTVKIPFVLDYNTEVIIYKNKFGEGIEKDFLPGVLKNVAKAIISTRMDKDSAAIKKWIKNPALYSKYLDKDNLLLKMEIYTGSIPIWMSEEDIKRFNRKKRKEIINESTKDGEKGISGRQSLNIFNTFYSRYSKKSRLIDMDMIKSFFSQKRNLQEKEIPKGFLDSLQDSYDYYILQEIKDAIYYYNKKQITNDILNYLFCVNFEVGEIKICHYTGETVEITNEYFNNFEKIFLGSACTESERILFRKNVRTEYVTKTLSQEIRIQNLDITATSQFLDVFNKYKRSLKENVLSPYHGNENFRRAIIDYDKPGFKTYDQRLKRDVKLLIENMIKKFGYTKVGAKQICLYALDKGLVKKFEK